MKRITAKGVRAGAAGQTVSSIMLHPSTLYAAGSGFVPRFALCACLFAYAGNEVVEVNGFTYVRKRKAPQVHQQEPSLKRLQQAHLGVIAPAPSAAKFIQPQLLQQQQQQDHSVAGDESGPAVASSQEAGPMAASQAGSMEAGALSTEECNGSQVHVQLLPHKQVEPGDGELVKAATLELHMDAAAQAHSYPTTPARPLCAEVIPAEASRQLSPEGLGAQLASCLPALCPALVKLHFVVARALDAAVHQVTMRVHKALVLVLGCGRGKRGRAVWYAR